MKKAELACSFLVGILAMAVYTANFLWAVRVGGASGWIALGAASGFGWAQYLIAEWSSFWTYGWGKAPKFNRPLLPWELVVRRVFHWTVAPLLLLSATLWVAPWWERLVFAVLTWFGLAFTAGILMWLIRTPGDIKRTLERD